MSLLVDDSPLPTAPLDDATLAAWEAELAGLLAAAPAQRITDQDRAAAYFAAEARRRLAQVRHDRQTAGLLMGFWRHARHSPGNYGASGASWGTPLPDHMPGASSGEYKQP